MTGPDPTDDYLISSRRDELMAIEVPDTAQWRSRVKPNLIPPMADDLSCTTLSRGVSCRQTTKQKSCPREESCPLADQEGTTTSKSVHPNEAPFPSTTMVSARPRAVLRSFSRTPSPLYMATG